LYLVVLQIHLIKILTYSICVSGQRKRKENTKDDNEAKTEKKKLKNASVWIMKNPAVISHQFQVVRLAVN
jgi:hypothetical protein